MIRPSSPPSFLENVLALAVIAWPTGRRIPARAPGNGEETAVQPVDDGRLSALLQSWEAAGVPRDIVEPIDTTGDRTDSAHARALLRSVHQVQRVCDLNHVHDSWILRTLRHETTAIRAAVLASLPEDRQEQLARTLQVSPSGPIAGSPAHPDVIAWLRRAWSEWLVGDLQSLPDDPAVIQVITTWKSRDLSRLLFRIALAKWSYLCKREGDAAPKSLSPEEMLHFRSFRETWGPRSDPLVALAQRDFQKARDLASAELARIGLVTIGRLLSVVNAYRARWAMQHLPYDVAKALRPHMTLDLPGVHPEDLVSWESRILEIAARTVSCVDRTARATSP